MANKRLGAMQSVFFLPLLTAYNLSFCDRKCGTRMVRYAIYFISRLTEIALLLGSLYQELLQGLSKQSINEFKKQITSWMLEMLNLSMSLRNKLKAGMALTAHVDYVGFSLHNLDICNTITDKTQNFGF